MSPIKCHHFPFHFSHFFPSSRPGGLGAGLRRNSDVTLLPALLRPRMSTDSIGSIEDATLRGAAGGVYAEAFALRGGVLVRGPACAAGDMIRKRCVADAQALMEWWLARSVVMVGWRHDQRDALGVVGLLCSISLWTPVAEAQHNSRRRQRRSVRLAHSIVTVEYLVGWRHLDFFVDAHCGSAASWQTSTKA